MILSKTAASCKLDFAFESDAAASFLAVKCGTKLIEYHASMLEHNRISYVLPLNIVRQEGINCFYYNITSKISLSFYLQRRKFSRDQFLRFLLNVTLAVNESAGYLLSDSSFIFDPDFIYVNPDTLEPALVYVPVSLEKENGGSFRDFISELLMLHINIPGFDTENLVQKILSAVKSQVFNIKGFLNLLSELLYGHAGDKIAESPGQVKGQTSEDADNKTVAAGTLAGALAGIFEKKQKGLDKPVLEDRKPVSSTDVVINEGGHGEKIPWITILAVLAQLVMGTVIFICRNFLNNIGNNPAATYVAVAMIVLAIDLLIFKKVKGAGLIKIENNEKSAGNYNSTAEKPENPLDQLYKDFKTEMKHASEEAAAAAPPPEITAANKTELLGNFTYGVRLLKRRGKPNEEDDIYIDKDDFIIGRLEGHVDRVLRNNAVGKLHAQFIYRNGTSFIKDLNSVNGTFINSMRIESNKEFEIKDNDIIRIANIEYEFIGGCCQ